MKQDEIEKTMDILRMRIRGGGVHLDDTQMAMHILALVEGHMTNTARMVELLERLTRTTSPEKAGR
jgi:hypothetical protein